MSTEKRRSNLFSGNLRTNLIPKAIQILGYLGSCQMGNLLARRRIRSTKLVTPKFLFKTQENSINKGKAQDCPLTVVCLALTVTVSRLNPCSEHQEWVV